MNSDTFPHNMTQSSNIRIREPVKPETYSYLVDRSVLKKEETLHCLKSEILFCKMAQSSSTKTCI